MRGPGPYTGEMPETSTGPMSRNTASLSGLVCDEGFVYSDLSPQIRAEKWAEIQLVNAALLVISSDVDVQRFSAAGKPISATKDGQAKQG